MPLQTSFPSGIIPVPTVYCLIMKAVVAMKTGLSLYNKNTEWHRALRDLSHAPATNNRSISTVRRCRVYPTKKTWTK